MSATAPQKKAVALNLPAGNFCGFEKINCGVEQKNVRRDGAFGSDQSSAVGDRSWHDWLIIDPVCLSQRRLFTYGCGPGSGKPGSFLTITEADGVAAP
jgi:hypothetical protein